MFRRDARAFFGKVAADIPRKMRSNMNNEALTDPIQRNGGLVSSAGVAQMRHSEIFRVAERAQGFQAARSRA